MKSNLDLVNDTDCFPYDDIENVTIDGQGLYTLLWEDPDGDTYPIGYVLDRVAQELERMPATLTGGGVQLDRTTRTMRIFRTLTTEAERTAAAATLAHDLRSRGLFGLRRGWRNELWPVYGRRPGELLFSVERAAVGLFGAVRYGVHMTAYVENGRDNYRIWVPRRAVNKATFPGLLDNTVAGGLMTGEEPRECLAREADEEASLPAALIRACAMPVGKLTYIYVTKAADVGPSGLVNGVAEDYDHDDDDDGGEGQAGFVFPECEWAFDLRLPPGMDPQPKDGEVEAFELCDLETVRRDLARGAYKTNCALVILDFLVRHGHLTEAEEPRLRELQMRMHRELPFPGPHQATWREAAWGHTAL